MKRSASALPLLIAALTFWVFAPCIRFGFLRWDDLWNFTNNLYYRGLGWANVKWVFVSYKVGPVGPYQPLSWLTLELDYALWGMNPRGFHFTNLLIHCVNAVLFYFVALRLLAQAADAGARRSPFAGRLLALAAGLAALFFSIHPLRVESVVWVTERRDVLSGFFILLATLAYLRRCKETGAGFLSAAWPPLLFLCAVLAKATAVSWAWVFLILDVYPLKRLPPPSKAWLSRDCRPVLIEKIPFFFAAFAGGATAIFAMKIKNCLVSTGRFGVGRRAAAFFINIIFYFFKTLWPSRLSPFYRMPPDLGRWTPHLAIAVFTAAAIAAAVWRSRARLPMLAAAGLAYLLVIIPLTGVVQNGAQMAADRFSYLSCMPWAILFGGVILSAVSSLPTREKGLPAPAGAAVVALSLLWLVILGISARAQTLCWKDDVTLWSRAVSLDPDSGVSNSNLGAAFLNARRFPEALAAFQKNIQLWPGDPLNYDKAATALAQMGRLEEALRYSDQELKLDPRSVQGYVNRGINYLLMRHFDDAIADFGRAIVLAPGDEAAIRNLGAAYGASGRYENALSLQNEDVRLHPVSVEARLNLGLTLEATGRFSEAMRQFSEALRLEPNNPRARQALAELEISRAKAPARK